MNLIVGLGNPGKKYAETRHNFGYILIDSFAKDLNLSWRYNPDWIAYYIKTPLRQGFEGQAEELVLLKPATFMNKSGVSVSAAKNFYKIDKKDILIIHDELDLPFGKIRVSFDSLSAGHKGIESIIESLSGVEFGRMRIGIGKPNKKGEAEKYVLEEFTKEEQKKLDNIVTLSKEALRSYMANGIDATMNRFN